MFQDRAEGTLQNVFFYINLFLNKWLVSPLADYFILLIFFKSSHLLPVAVLP